MERLTPLPWQGELWAQLVEWRGQLPHALLVHGMRGIGKRHLIKAFSQLLLCESPIDAIACGHCPGCHLLAADNHPDLRWLTPAAQMPARADADEGTADPASGTNARSNAPAKPSREIVIDQVRKTGDFLSLTSHRGGRRVVLLIPAESLNAAASNALLKMLEEPPPATLFLAVSDELDAVLATIRSRCLLLRAPMPTPRQAIDWLKSQGVTDAPAKLAESGGAPMGLVAGEIAGDGQNIDPALRDVLLKLLARGPELSAAEIANSVPKDVAVAPSIRLFQRWAWDLLAERLGGQGRYYPPYQRQVSNLARTIEPSRVADWAATLAQTQATSEHPLNARLVVESALVDYIDTMSNAKRKREPMRMERLNR